MKPALISFAVTAALLSLNVLPRVWTGEGPADAYETRHAQENKADVEARLGITRG
ncbi:MAG TPA: hypothetical protein VGB70_11410 [Allosphingosinicella sp.]|jgi:hypothetical protein